MALFGINTNTVAGKLATGGYNPPPGPAPKERLFANPSRPASFAAGGRAQIAQQRGAVLSSGGGSHGATIRLVAATVARTHNIAAGNAAFGRAMANNPTYKSLVSWLKSQGYSVAPLNTGGSSGGNRLAVLAGKGGAPTTPKLPPKLQAAATAAGLSVSASGSTAAITRPGGSSAGGATGAGGAPAAPTDSGAGVLSAFQAYEDEINMPRTATADSGFVSLKTAGWQAPFQWWWQSFAGKYAAEETSHAPPASAAPASPALPATPGGSTAAPTPGGSLMPKGKTRGLQPQVVAALAWARAHGWHGSVISGFRTFAQQQAIYNSGVRPAAVPGTSMHEKGLAVDVTDAAGFQRALANAPASAKLYSGASFGDPNHFSTTGH